MLEIAILISNIERQYNGRKKQSINSNGAESQHRIEGRSEKRQANRRHRTGYFNKIPQSPAWNKSQAYERPGGQG